MRAPVQMANGTARTAKRWLFAVAIVLATVCLAQDSRPASASAAEILFSRSNTSPVWAPAVYLVPGGPSVTVYVWAKNVSQATSGFEVDVTYDASIVSVTSVVAYKAWLELYGRSAMCPTPLIEPVNSGDPYGPWHANAACVTIGTSSGTQGSGLLAALTLQTTAEQELGISPLTLTEGTFLLDMNIDPPGRIPVKLRSSTVRTAPCADFTEDGMVRIGDILFVVDHYGMEGDPVADLADLDGDGLIRVGDIIIAVGQYGISC